MSHWEAPFVTLVYSERERFWKIKKTQKIFAHTNSAEKIKNQTKPYCQLVFQCIFLE